MIVKIVKIHYLGFLRCCCGQCGVSSFLDSSLVRLIFLKIYRPLPMQLVLTTVLIYCTYHFQGGSLCFSFFCLLVSSVSYFCPDTRASWWTLFQAHFFSRAVVREGRCKQITLVCSRSVSATVGLLLLLAHVPSLPTLLRLQVAPPGSVRGQPWDACASQV